MFFLINADRLGVTLRKRTEGGEEGMNLRNMTRD